MTSTKSLSASSTVCLSLSLKALYALTFTILLLFTSPALSQQAISTVQHNSSYVESGSSIAVAFNSNVTSGNLLLVAVSTYNGETLVTPTDTLNTPFIKLVTGSNTGNAVAAIYAANASSSGADTVTCSIANSASDNIHCHIYEVQGATTTVDQTGTASQAGPALTVSTSAATTNAIDYVLAYFSDNHNVAYYTVGLGFGDTEASEDSAGGDSGFSEDEVVTATGIQTATVTESTTDTSVNVIVALKATGVPPAATPLFSPSGGSFLSGQSVSISDTTPSATIYYSTDGTTPTTGSATYSGAIAVPASETLEAIATAATYAQSAVGTAAFNIGAGAFSGPIETVQHNSGTNETASSIAVPFKSNITSGNLLLVAESTYYGLALVPPTDSKGNSFTQLVTAGAGSGPSVAAIYSAIANASGADTVTCNINSTNNIHCHIYEVEGVKAVLDKPGNSTVTNSALTVSTNGATTYNVDYLFAYFSDNDSGTTYLPGSGWGDTEQTSTGDSGFSEDEIVLTPGVQTATATASNSGDSYVNLIVALETSGTPAVPTPSIYPSGGSYISVQTVNITDSYSGAVIHYTTDGSTPSTSSPVYASALTLSDTQTLQAIATAGSYANSLVATAVFNINLPADTPTFSPTPGTYPTAQSVTISDATPDATIYYTTDNSAPTTNSSVYTAPIAVASWETVEAVAIAPGSSVSVTGIAPYTIGNAEAAAPTFSPGAGTYASSQAVAISDETAGATIYFTTDGSTPSTNSAVYASAINVSASETLQAIATAGGYAQSGIGSAVYTINATAGDCAGMSVGSSVAGTANMNGFVPFLNAPNMTSLWATNIANAAVDPNNAMIQTTGGYSGENARVLFGSSPGDGGIPFAVVDSSQTPAVPIHVVTYTGNSDVVVAPFPINVPIEGNYADCSGWPDTYNGDAHALVADRNTCWLYETFNTNRCNGLFDSDGEVVWDMLNGEMRPWGWSSVDAAGLSVFAGLVKYDEAASGHVNHAIRFTMQQSKADNNGGYFVEPASHAAGTIFGAPVVEGMRIRLKASYNTSGYSAINTAILTAMQQYGLIMADNGGYGYYIGATDSRWNDSDLANLGHIPMSDFDVIDGTPGSTTMTPAYPGWDSVTAPTGPEPVINSFAASPQTVSAGTPVTFNYSVSGDSYDYIDMIGPVRLTQNGGGTGINTGSVTIYPTATQTYTLYSVNQYANNGVAAGYGVTPSTPITIEVPGSVVVPPTFTPPAGPYTTAQEVTFNTTTYPFASFYYTTDGTTPTYPPTGTTIEYPQIPQPQSTQSAGSVEEITVSANETVSAIAVVQGYASPSAVTTGVYEIGPITATPAFSPVGGTYGVAQTITISDSTSGATVYYTTDGTTPTTGSSIYSSPLPVSSNETLEAVATSIGNNNSVVASAAYSIGGTAATPTFSPVAGNYVGNQSITISDADSGITIYYTTSGTTPSTSSTAYTGAISVSTSETLEAIAAGNGYTNSAVGSTAYTILEATPTFSPVAGSYVGAQTITISDASSGATIYYTTNGSTPTTSSSTYSSAIPVSKLETLEAIASGIGNGNSSVGSAAYTIAATTPTFSPVAGDYGVALAVTISDTTPSSTIYYTTDGTTPTTASSVYSAPVTVSVTETLEAMATAAGDSNSSAGSTAYTITIGGQAATPSLSLGTGSYIGTQTITISDTSIGATIYYTLTPGSVGTPPTTGSTVYTGPVTVPSTSVLEAYAVGGGFTASAVNSAAYSITITASYVQQCNNYGNYVNSDSCTLTGVTAGDAIMIGVWSTVTPVSSVTATTGTPVSVISNYNANGTWGYLTAYLLPNSASGNITLTANTSSYGDTWISAVEYTHVMASPLDSSGSASSGSSNYSPSNVNSSNFTTTSEYDMLWSMCTGEYATWTPGTAPITWTQVTYSIVTGDDNGLLVEDGVAGAAGTYYGQCYKTNSGYDRGIIAVSLKGALPSAATPIFSPVAGTYTSIQTVTISDGTTSSTIYYTTDGSTPTTASPTYSTAITVSATETINALAVAAGYSNSSASAVYTINLPQVTTPTFSPVAGNYATAQTVTISDSTGGASIYYTTNGSTPTTGSTPYASAITVSASAETLNAIAVESGYTNSAVGSAVYTIGNPVATPGFSPAAGTYTSVQTVSISDSTPSSTIYYTTNGSAPSTSSSIYSTPVTVAATETINAIATAAGFVQSNLASAAYAIYLPTAATPLFSPAAGTYGAAQSVVIASTTPSATIYYTTNGTSPTTSSPVYSSAVAVSTTQTLEAIAVANGYNASAVASAAYTISLSGVTAPSFVQQCSQFETSGATGIATCTLTGVTAGDTLVIGVWNNDAALKSITSSTTAQPVSIITNFNGGGSNGYISDYLLPNTPAGSITITISNTSIYSYLFISVVEYTNVAASPLDASASGFFTNATYGTATITTSSFTTTSASDMLWSFCSSYTGSGLTVGTAPITWTSLGSTSPYAEELWEDGLAGAAGSYTGQCNKTAGYDMNILTVALLGASSPTVATPTFSPGTDTYASVQTVTISDTTPSSTIYYTTNGTTPTTGSSVYSTPVSVSSTETLEAVGVAAGDTNSSVGIADYIINLPQAATPSFSPVGGSYTSVQSVSISDATAGNTIYYTTNGTTPTTGSTPYSSAITVSATETLEAIATAYGYSTSTAGSAVYTLILPAATPTFSPTAGTYSSVQTVTISDTTPNSAIYYTTDGSTPTYPVTGTTQLYSAGTSVSATETVKAIAEAAGYTTSAVGSAVYTIVPPASWPFMDIFNRSDCTSNCGSGVDLGPDYTQFVTPTTAASDPLEIVSSAVTLGAWSAPASYVMSGAVLTEAGYTFTANQYAQVTVNSIGGSNAPAYIILRYTDANDYNYVELESGGPSLNTVSGGVSSWVGAYSGGVTVGHVYRVTVIGNAYTLYDNGTGYNGTSDGTITTSVNSAAGPTGLGIDGYSATPAVLTNFQTNNCTTTCPADNPTVATPTFSPAAGTYTSIQTVTISDATGSATIYYTTDGTAPTTGSAQYSGGIIVSANETLEAIATSSGYSASAVGTAAYTINLPVAATPAFNPAAGTYTSIQTVTISDAVGGAAIYYTTDGSTPTYPISGTTQQYSSAITVPATETVNAIAVAAGYTQSLVGSAAYTINLPPVTFNGALPYVNFGSQAIGTASAAQPLNFSITSGTTVGSIGILTTGVAGKDFADAGSSTCTAKTYSSATNCVVNVSVKPAASGLRQGAVVFYSGAGYTGSVMNVVLIYAVGTGPQVAYSPVTPTSIAPTVNSLTLNSPQGIGVDDVGDLFITDSVNTRLLEVPAGGGTATAINTTVGGVTSGGSAVAVDGAGNIFVADWSNNWVVEVPIGGGAPFAIGPTVGSLTLQGPDGVAVDGAGDLYIADSVNNRVVEVPAGGGAAIAIAPTVNSTPMGEPSDVTVDAAGDLFISDQDNGWVVEVPAGDGTPFAINPTVNSLTLNYPQAAKVDGAGDLFIADTGNARVVEVPAGGGAAIAFDPTVNNLTFSSSGPQGIAVDGAGNLFMSDPGNNWVVELQRSQPPTLNFNTETNVGSIDTTDGTQTVRVKNIGNQALTLTALSYPADFSMASGDANACSGTSSLNAGQLCDLPIQFTPENPGLLNEDVTLTDNALNVTGAQQLVPVNGTGKALVAATPTFSPAAGTYTTIQTVTISDTAPSAIIYYTTNGSTPTTGSAVYSSAIIVSSSQTLNALATSAGETNSAVGSAAYTINLPTAATPSFSPGSGSYGTAQSVTISDTTPSSTIYYTTNGTAPTTGSSVYSSAISVSSNETLEAIAVAYNYLNSATNSATYTIAAATPSFSPGSGTYGSAQSVTISDTTPSATIYYTTNGTTPSTGSSVYSAAITVTGAETLEAIATASGYGASAVASAAYTTSPIQPTFSPGPGTYAGTQTVTISDATGGATIYYTTNGTTPTTSSTTYSAPVSVTATEIVEAIAAISGAPASAVTSGIYTIETPAVLTTPAPGSTLTGTSVTFAWSPGNTAKNFELWVGTTAGSSNLYNSGSVTATSETVSDLPSNGQPVYVRLYWYINGSWSYASYTYTATGAPTQAAITTPATGSTLTGTSVAFAWTPGNTATNFELWAGTTAGSSNLYNSGSVTVTTETVTDLPGNGQPVYVRLYSYIDGAWEYTSYTYTATGSATPAALTAPTPGSKLTGTSVAFAWTPGNVATQFQLWVGTTSGSSNLYNSNAVTATTETVSDLPDNDSEVYVRLYSYIAGAWQYTSYTYTSAGTVTQAALTTPTPGSTLTGTSVTFAWTPGNTAKNFQLYLGSTGVGTNNLYNSGSVTVTSETVSDLPSNGEKVYARLFSYINGAWVYTDYTYTTMGAPTQAALTTPTPGTTLTGTSITFSWTPGNTATHFQLYLGTSAGSNNLYNSGSVTVTSETVSDLPSNGLPVYARLFSYVNGAWIYTDYTYTTAGAATPAALTTPTPGSQLTSSSVTFSWTPGNTAKNFELWLGSTNGASNLYNSGSVTVTSKTVTGLPNNGEKIYARLYWYINGAWQYASYTYSAF